MARAWPEPSFAIRGAGHRVRITATEFDRHHPLVMHLVAPGTVPPQDATGGVAMMIFRDRAGAGRQLAERLTAYANRSDVIVLALPRGGVPVGFEVASALKAPLDVFVVRKLGMPSQEELAIGAIASGGVVVINDRWMTRIPGGALQSIVEQERAELARREKAYRGTRAPVDVRNKIVVVVDDGLATGATMRAAIRALRQRNPNEIVVAVPVGARESVRMINDEADRVICLSTPETFRAVSMWYADFPQVSDEEVGDLLARASEPAERVAVVTQ